MSFLWRCRLTHLPSGADYPALRSTHPDLSLPKDRWESRGSQTPYFTADERHSIAIGIVATDAVLSLS